MERTILRTGVYPLSGLLRYSISHISISNFGFFWEDGRNFLYNDASFWAGVANFFWLPAGFNELTRNGQVQGRIFCRVFICHGKDPDRYGIYQTAAAFRKYI